MMREEVEVCPYCGGENILQWDVEANGYEATCQHCGKPMMLCDACLHSDDNKEMKCYWSEATGCFRKRKFADGDAMYKYLTAGNDLYNKETGEYVFQYNDAGALCTYYLKPETAKEIAAKAKEDDEYWGAYLGGGGTILDDPNNDEYRFSKDDYKRNLYLEPSFTFCKENFAKRGWVDTREY